MVGSIAAGLVAAVIAGGSAAACPDEGGLPCGSVISADTTLRGDVTCTPAQQAAGLAALTVTASPVVLDLGGHTVTGDIRVNGVDGEDTHVTVRNGTALMITAWWARHLGITGVRLQTLSIHYSQVEVSRSELGGRGSGGVRHDEVSGLTVADSTLSRIIVTGSAGAVSISRSVLRDVTVYGGVSGRGGGYVAVTDSRLLRSTIHAEARAVIERNVIRDAPWMAVDIRMFYLPTGVTVRDNVITGGRIGIHLAGSRVAPVQVTGNTVREAAITGVLLEGFPGPGPSEYPTTITDNRLIGNGHHSGGTLDSVGRPLDDGLHIVDRVAGTPLLVARNRTRDNADHGIEVAAGTVQDGGGNTSRGNPGGCLGIRCG